MYWRDVQFHIRSNYVFPSGWDIRRWVRATVYMTEMFWHLIPKKFTLDGSGETVLRVGHYPSSMRYWQIHGISEVHCDEFDVDRFCFSDKSTREHMLCEPPESRHVAPPLRVHRVTACFNNPSRKMVPGTTHDSRAQASVHRP